MASENNNEKVLMEERYLPEKVGSLGSKTTSMLIDGSIQKDVRIGFCDSCGVLLEGKLAICSTCHRKMCRSCIILHENRIYCSDCAKEIISLTKREFIVLLGIAEEIKPTEIKKASCMSSDDLQEALCILLERNLIKRKGLSIFSYYNITDKGLEVLPTCEQIYRNEGDVIHFLENLRGNNK